MIGIYLLIGAAVGTVIVIANWRWGGMFDPAGGILSSAAGLLCIMLLWPLVAAVAVLVIAMDDDSDTPQE